MKFFAPIIIVILLCSFASADDMPKIKAWKEKFPHISFQLSKAKKVAVKVSAKAKSVVKKRPLRKCFLRLINGQLVQQ